MNLIARLARIKAAQQELIALSGGIDGAVATLDDRYGRSTVGRWNNDGDTTLMPLDALIRLESATGRAAMTSALAEINGRRLADDPVDAAPNGNVMNRHAEAIVQMGELISTGALAFADGQLTPAEARQIDRAAAKVMEALAELRKASAVTRADGGFKVVGG